MKVSTLLIVSIPIVLGLQIKDTVDTTTENTFWYQLFGTPSKTQPAGAALTATTQATQAFTPISTIQASDIVLGTTKAVAPVASSSSATAAAPWYQGLFAVGRTTLAQITTSSTPISTPITTTRSTPPTPPTTTNSPTNNNNNNINLLGTTSITTRSTPISVSGDNVLTLFGNPNLSIGIDQSNSVPTTKTKTTASSSSSPPPSSSSSSLSNTKSQPTISNDDGNGVLTLFGNSESISDIKTSTQNSGSLTSSSISNSNSYSASITSRVNSSSNDNGIKSIPNSSEFLASLINGLGATTNTIKNHSSSTTSKYFNSSSITTTTIDTKKLSSSKSIYSNSTISKNSSSSTFGDGGDGGNLFGLILNSISASKTIAAESTLSTSTTGSTGSDNSNTKDYSSYSGTITSFPSTTGSLTGNGNKLIDNNKYLINIVWTNLILIMIMFFT